MITNVKLSLNYIFPKKWESEFECNLKKNDFNFRKHGNMLIAKKRLSICVIKKKNLEEGKEQFVHINLTGVKNLQNVNSSISFLESCIFPKNCKRTRVKIDNISYNFVYPKYFDFNCLKTLKNMRHNFEKFPAVFFKLQFGTAIIFRNKKINIVGCKSKQELRTSIKEVCKQLKTLT